MKVVSKRQPTEEEWRAMLFGWKVVKHVKSNAIVYAGNASRQHGYDVIDNLKIKPQQVIGYISGTKQGQKQAEANGFRFYGATWDTSDLNVLSTGTTISKPTEIIDILERV